MGDDNKPGANMDTKQKMETLKRSGWSQTEIKEFFQSLRDAATTLPPTMSDKVSDIAAFKLRDKK